MDYRNLGTALSQSGLEVVDDKSAVLSKLPSHTLTHTYVLGIKWNLNDDNVSLNPLTSLNYRTRAC